ncbi:MAG: hypothetical protein N2648_00725 [Aquificaceae bacterium]|nr:hypothetical protein [Aquificaceae bacterium]MCS7195867.1 hypothetical protein [Aquificaceae bacterium]MCX7989153.1 hypothetical protein [Aquificaceae bacterium]MDW8032326.1 hypothetical protein [Aquificaceae bacterium]MDW8294056.1 hypothetical protein [Aquificaceae bacterium]
MEGSNLWEEALVEEVVYLIAHLAHAEQHLMELEGETKLEDLVLYIDELRSRRKSMGNLLFSILEISGEKGGEFRSKVESLWCVLKHLSMALVHCDESAEKVIRRIDCATAQGREEEAKKLGEKLKELYDLRQSLRNSIREFLFEVSKKLAKVQAIRCREDLCLLEGEENALQRP